METSMGPANVLLEPRLIGKIQHASKSIPKSVQWKLLILFLVLNDLLLTGLAFRAAYFVRFELSLGIFRLDGMPSIVYYRGVALLLIPVWLGIFTLMGLYSKENLLGGTKEYSQVFNAATLGMVLIMAIGFLAPDFIFARGLLLLAWTFTCLFVAAGRFILRRIVYYLRRHGYFLRTAVIIGANEEARVLTEQLLRWKTSGLFIVGFVDNNAPPGSNLYHNLKSLGAIKDLPAIIERHDINDLILTNSALPRDELLAIFSEFGVSDRVNMHMSSGLFEIINTGLRVSELASVPLVRVNKVRLTGADHFLKFVLDYLITLAGLIVISPILLVIAIAIKLGSPGPVIFRRRVMGVNGRQFDAFKFRSMVPNGDEILARHPELQAELAENYKLINDPRVTRVGQFLRKTSLDELPQLFNVLKREMSLVGPRMISPAEITKYNQWDMNLLTVQPGITGLWQVSGRSDINYEERVRLDMHYIRNWSIWLDLQILIATIPAVIKGRGAY